MPVCQPRKKFGQVHWPEEDQRRHQEIMGAILAMSVSRLSGKPCPCETSCSQSHPYHSIRQQECSLFSSLTSSTSPTSSSRGITKSAISSKVNRIVVTNSLHRPVLSRMTNKGVFSTIFIILILLIIGFHPSDAKQGMC